MIVFLIFLILVVWSCFGFVKLILGEKLTSIVFSLITLYILLKI